MTTMDRKSAEFWWSLKINGKERAKFIAAPDVAYYTKENIYDKWKPVTWADIHKKRTEKIQANIAGKRLHIKIKPCLVWVFSHGYWLMGGYYTIIKTLGKEYYLNFRNVGLSYGVAGKLQIKIMQVFPLCLPMPELFYGWMILFAEKFKNKRFYKGFKNQGVSRAWCKIDEYGNLVDILPNGFEKTEVRSEKLLKRPNLYNMVSTF